MKKSLIALAVLGALSGAASAQSSVTLYGIVDIGLQWNRERRQHGHDALRRASQQESAWSIDSGYQSGSRFGLRGAEALGGNWAAVFALEGGFDPQPVCRARAAVCSAARPTPACATTPVGTVAFGRLATPSSGTGDFDLWGFVDPFGTGWGINSAWARPSSRRRRCAKTTRSSGRRRAGPASSLPRSTPATSTAARPLPSGQQHLGVQPRRQLVVGSAVPGRDV